MQKLLSIALIFVLCQASAGFRMQPVNRCRIGKNIGTHPAAVQMSSDGSTDSFPKSPLDSSTRQTLNTISLAALGVAASTLFVSQAAKASDKNAPIVVLGSGGKTGKLIVQYLAAKGASVRPTYRGNAENKFKEFETVEAPAQADVTKIDTLEPALRGASSVIFAASASRGGGTADQVDYIGLENVAKECVRLKIPRLIVISSGAITRPNSLGFKITNLFGRIMEYKLKGELALKAAYSSADPSVSYAIIRPGGLLDDKAVGAGGITLNQGDSISGEVNRADVAECAAAAALSTSLPKAVTFEVYQTGKSGPLEDKFAKVSGYERSGNVLGADYNKLFEGLKSGEVTI
jgi:uncharacterized protein YbjT (DUF2867 family)